MCNMWNLLHKLYLEPGNDKDEIQGSLHCGGKSAALHPNEQSALAGDPAFGRDDVCGCRAATGGAGADGMSCGELWREGG